MNITSARWIRYFDWPVLALTIGGKNARIHLEQKLLDRGLVMLEDEWRDQLEPIIIEIDGQAQTLRNYTDDPLILRLTREFRKATDSGTFEPKRIELPDRD